MIDRERIAERFSRVVIASGDGAFAQAAASLTVAGCHVTVVTRRTGLSKRLALAAGLEVIYIEPPDLNTPISASATTRQAA